MKFQTSIEVKNKKAYFEYEISDKYTSGIVLTGTEIKSIRQGKVAIKESFCEFKSGELFIVNMHIDPYEMGTYNNHEPRRKRKLLLNRQELNKLFKGVKTKGMTIVPLKLFLSEKGLAKILLGLAKGKKIHDKRESIKEKDLKRELDRKLKNY